MQTFNMYIKNTSTEPKGKTMKGTKMKNHENKKLHNS